MVKKSSTSKTSRIFQAALCHAMHVEPKTAAIRPVDVEIQPSWNAAVAFSTVLRSVSGPYESSRTQVVGGRLEGGGTFITKKKLNATLLLVLC